MITLQKFVFNSFQVNTYIIYDESNKCVIVDPANYIPEEDQVIQNFISERGLDPVLCINTHCHIDHVLGLKFVTDQYSIPFRAHKEENNLLKNAPVMGKVFGFTTQVLPEMDGTISHHDTIQFGNSELIALHVPGHSPGSLSFHAENEKFVITGDALFEGSIGRTDLPGGDYDTLISSITNNLLTLDPEVEIWPGHGNQSTIGSELKNNPFLNDYKT